MKRIAFALLALLATASPAHAQAPGSPAPDERANVQAELVSSRAAVGPGETFVIGLRQLIRPRWHTYWRNPGDSGIATKIEWSLPAGFQAGPIEWPTPEAIAVEGLVNYGYANEVLFPIEMTAPKTLGPATLRAHAEWLACEEVCVPESADLTLRVTVARASQPDALWAPALAAARAAIPRPAGIQAERSRSGKAWILTASGGALDALLRDGGVRAPRYFPYAGDVIAHGEPQNPRINGDSVRFALTPAPGADLSSKPLAGVISLEARAGGAWVKRAFEIGDVRQGASAPAAAGAAGGGVGLVAALLYALLGGLVLNVMPCVFPVLSVKALSLAKAADEQTARRHGVLFLAGVMTTFLALAGALIALQSAGAAIGWGFQLQEPLVVGALALLFFAIGLNLIGAYDIGAGVQNVGDGLAAKGGGAGAFFTGALAVAAATPCTAPFMAAALGFAAVQAPPVSLLVFAALGLGFAAPFVALSFAPALRSLLPKPGAWMETFRQLLAFPMFAASIWLVWVLAQQAGPGGLVAALAIMLAFAFIVWAFRAFKRSAARAASSALALLVAAGAVAFGLHPGAPIAVAATARAAATEGLTAEPWSPEREAALRAQGRAVFINFTAAWCVTCQVNEKLALQSAAVAKAFAAGDVAYLKADWTTRDAGIAHALKKHGRNGVPLYLFYPAGATAPVAVLPQILTPGLVIETLGQAKEASR